ncbi:1,4-dihydroxy-2-naphthoate polyprenyltransferase [Ornithinimicrobium ciconiae]|uniref:1,4-dihydroxy-2-naphthoate octaprenyltransferase n=1 Tax=Ornithinimicrobium ciconiae TaxID=2594265 RepID=A0A516GED4_9MICO|nr:1,4-dihydroxy-2-naphthoate polyprenyltransferase [Ornithinimicrobium ciconiae]QDO89848.1 1,4-dihydroxy-2-naphthoate polyprenyltransferase [Ornithinimicrobium ciconiae]
MASLAQWVEGARPRTFPAAIAPVAVGTGSAHVLGSSDLGLALLALLVSLALQIGVNYANDYSDGVRGTDEERVGPIRLVGQRLADPANVKLMAFLWFGFAALCGLALVALSNTPVLLLIGVAAIVAAWRYTGGDNPYGYRGLGEVMVFIFFGLVAVLGTTWTQAHSLDAASWSGAVGVGSITCAVLVANNLRDIPGDTTSGKRTLAVRMGDRRTRQLYVGLLALPLLAAGIAALLHLWALLALLSAPLGYLAARPVLRGALGRDLVPAIGSTGRYLLGYSALLTLGLVLSV